MPEARDRLSRPGDEVAEMYSRRRTSVGSLRIRADDGESINRTPFRWGATPLTGGGTGRQMGGAHSTWTTTIRGGGGGRGLFGTPGTVHRRGGQSQNTPVAGSSGRRSRGGRTESNRVLPSWYPHTPLRDITHVVQATERRRARLGEGEGRNLGSPVMANPSSSHAQLEHDVSLVTPNPTLAFKTYKTSNLGKVPKILAEITNQDSEFLTPQKKLLNSIDVVEKVVMEELRRLKRTPSAKKAEREKRVKTLMTMR